MYESYHRVVSSLVVAIALASGCATAGSRGPKQPDLPDVAVQVSRLPNVHANVEQFVDLKVVESAPDALDIVADPNLRPIRIWLVKEAGAVTGVYVVGHADGACCPVISRLVSDVANDSRMAASWFSFGFGAISAGENPSAREMLGRLSQALRAGAESSECAGQVQIFSLRGDRVAALGRRLQKTATAAYRAASQSDRPLFLWHDFEHAHPALVPVYVPATNGRRLKPLAITMQPEDFGFPAMLARSVSLDGIGQYIASLRSDLEQQETRIKLQALLVRHPNFADGYQSKDRLRFNRNDIRKTLKYLATLKSYTKVTRQFIDLVAQIENSPAWERSMRRELARWSAELDRLTNLAERARRARGKRGARPWVHVTPSKSGKNQAALRSMKRQLSKIDAKKQRARIRMALRKARELRSNPPQDPILSLVDSALRGWPATFSSERAERSFDRWMKKNQLRVWRLVRTKLRAQGVDVGSDADPLGALAASNMLFRVTRTGDGIQIEPLYVLGGPFHMVADPDAGLVRFEAAHADQNLHRWL